MGVPIFRIELPKLEATFAAELTAPAIDLFTLFIVELAALPREFIAEVVAFPKDLIPSLIGFPIEFIVYVVALFTGFPMDPILGDLGAEFIL